MKDDHIPSNDEVDLPWFTDKEVSEAKLEKEFLKIFLQKFGNARTLWFKPSVLDKYKTHRYCILDIANPFNCILAFLDYDTTTILTSISFAVHGSNNIISIDRDEYFHLPPKERKHWYKHMIIDKLTSYK